MLTTTYIFGYTFMTVRCCTTVLLSPRFESLRCQHSCVSCFDYKHWLESAEALSSVRWREISRLPVVPDDVPVE